MLRLVSKLDGAVNVSKKRQWMIHSRCQRECTKSLRAVRVYLLNFTAREDVR